MGGGEEAKLFVGGLSQETTKEKLKEHFLYHGTVTDAVVMYDSSSSRSRGFGFVTFDKADVIDSILSTTQTIDDKEVECKRACPREVMASRQYGGAHYSPQFAGLKTNKIFVGGLPDLSTEEFKTYFSKYGNVVDAVLMTDKNTNRPRGFGFITYDSTDVVDEVVRKFHDHQIKDKWVEVKKAQSKDQLMQRQMDPAMGRGFGGFGGGYGGPPYGGYYDNYRPGYPPYDTRRPYGGPGYDPYGAAGYGGPGGYGPQDGRKQYAQYGPNRGGGGSYRGVHGGDPYNGVGSGVPYGSQVGGGGGSSYGGQPGGGASAYSNSTYGGGSVPY